MQNGKRLSTTRCYRRKHGPLYGVLYVSVGQTNKSTEVSAPPSPRQRFQRAAVTEPHRRKSYSEHHGYQFQSGPRQQATYLTLRTTAPTHSFAGRSRPPTPLYIISSRFASHPVVFRVSFCARFSAMHFSNASWSHGVNSRLLMSAAQ